MLRGRFPPSSTEVLAVGADVLAVGANILGVGPPAVAGAVIIALAILPHPLPCLGVCLVLAIYHTNSCLLVNHPSAHYPTQLPNSIHTASSLFTLSTCFSLGCSISLTTNFQFLQISLDTLAHGDGYLTLMPIVCMTPILGGYSLVLILILTMLE